MGRMRDEMRERERMEREETGKREKGGGGGGRLQRGPRFLRYNVILGG